MRLSPALACKSCCVYAVVQVNGCLVQMLVDTGLHIQLHESCLIQKKPEDGTPHCGMCCIRADGRLLLVKGWITPHIRLGVEEWATSVNPHSWYWTNCKEWQEFYEWTS